MCRKIIKETKRKLHIVRYCVIRIRFLLTSSKLINYFFPTFLIGCKSLLYKKNQVDWYARHTRLARLLASKNEFWVCGSGRICCLDWLDAMLPPPSNQSTQRILPKRGSQNIKCADVFYSSEAWLVWCVSHMRVLSFISHKMSLAALRG